MLWLRMSSSLTEVSMILLVPSSRTKTFHYQTRDMSAQSSLEAGPGEGGGCRSGM